MQTVEETLRSIAAIAATTLPAGCSQLSADDDVAPT
jgi:hypothetical protein